MIKVSIRSGNGGGGWEEEKIKSRNWGWEERQVERDFPRNFLQVSIIQATKILQVYNKNRINVGKFGS